MEADEETSIRVPRTVRDLVDDYRRKGETMADAVRRAVTTARAAEA